MMKVYLVQEAHLCDDPYYQSGPTTWGVYASRESAQAVVDAYIAECKRKCEEQELDERDIWEIFPEFWVSERGVEP